MNHNYLFRDILHDTINYIRTDGLERIGDSRFTLIHPKLMHTRKHQIYATEREAMIINEWNYDTPLQSCNVLYVIFREQELS